MDKTLYESNRKMADSLEIKMINILYNEFPNTYLDYYSELKDLYKCADVTLIQNNGTEIEIGERIRKYEYLKYKDQFTIRETELKKILNGAGDYIIYAFTNPSETKIIKYTIIDLKIFRTFYSRIKEMRKHNIDNSPCFIVFNLQDYPANLIKASKEYPELMAQARTEQIELQKEKAKKQLKRMREVYATL